MRPVWQKAASFAARYHRNQLRSDRQTPYIAHPFRVALTLVNVFGVNDEHVVCASILHDVIEDTPCSYDVLAAEFGADVADMVIALTKDMRSPQPDRDAAYYDRLARASWQVRLIKLADAYDNLCDAMDLHDDRRTLAKNIHKANAILRVADNETRLDKPRKILRSLIETLQEGG